MKQCEECNIRPASMHITQIAGNETRTFHLCEECAGKHGITLSIDESAVGALAAVPLQTKQPDRSAPVPDRLCPGCGTRLSEFRTSGRLGCAACYAAFEQEIEAELVETFGSTEYKGRPYGAAEQGSVSQLRADLAAAIKNEQFERAAQLRDAIHSLFDTQSAKAS